MEDTWWLFYVISYRKLTYILSTSVYHIFFKSHIFNAEAELLKKMK